MKSFPVSLALTSLLIATQVDAAPVLIEYKARITSIREYNSLGSDVQVQSTAMPGFQITVGETAVGYLAYDTTTFLAPDGPWQLDYSLINQIDLSLRFANSPVLAFGHTALYATGWPNFRLAIDGGNGVDSVHSMDLQGQDGPGDLGGHLPAAGEWSGFGPIAGAIGYGFGYEQNDIRYDMQTSGDIYSVRVVTSVPEPSTFGMLGAGLGLIAMTCWRRRIFPGASAA